MAKHKAKRLEKRIKGVFIWVRNQIASYPYLLLTIIASVLLVGYLLIARFGLGQTDWLECTGFGPHISPDNGYYRPAKTLWDLLDLLVIPVVLAIGVWALNKAERKTEREVALDQQQQTTLQAYYDRMTDLLLKEGLLEPLVKKDHLKPSEKSPVRAVARTITLSTLRSLNDKRKGQVVKFLYESGLIDKDSAIVSMKSTDLNRADLGLANLLGSDLSFADLREADLGGADLRSANLVGAYLVRACLVGAYLRGADLEGVNLWGADLRKADLQEIDLKKTILDKAKYDCNTQWPAGFDPEAAGVVLRE